MVLQCYINTETTVYQMQKGYTSVADKLAGKASFTIALCDDNSAFVKSTTNPNQKTTLYPPPSAQVIQSISYSQKQDRIVVLLANSTICIYRMFKETALLEKIHE
jgi:hypothetical protein